MNHGIGSSSSCAPHTCTSERGGHAKTANARQEIFVQSAQSQAHIQTPSQTHCLDSQAYSLRKTKRRKSPTVILFTTL